MYDAVADEYCYPGTTVLKNKLDLCKEIGSFSSGTERDPCIPRRKRACSAFVLSAARRQCGALGLDEFDPAAFLAAMIASFEGDEGPIAAIVERLVDSK